jgi:hypothetical protein
MGGSKRGAASDERVLQLGLASPGTIEGSVTAGDVEAERRVEGEGEE